MSLKKFSLPAFIAVALITGVLALADLRSVPFHPDEATFLYLSGDFNLLFTQPLAMAWQPDQRNDAKQLYRTLDAPLGRYLVGFGRTLAGLPPLPVDWDWSKSWEENAQASALPSESLLFAGRVALAALLPFSLSLMFLAARRSSGDLAAWITGLLMAGNALLLLHGRRAVSEGAVVFTAALTLCSLLFLQKRPWLTGFPAALAFCAKYSLGALAPVGLVAVLWQPGKRKAAIAREAAVYCLIFIVVTVLLNPFLWAHPLQALGDALQNRADLAQRQVSDRPAQALTSPGLKLISLAGSLYLTPPLYEETGNYTQALQAEEQAYASNPLHSLLRSFEAGGILFFLGLLGFALPLMQFIREKRVSRSLALVWIATLIQALALLVMVPLPFQRYYLPLVPAACFWPACGIDRLVSAARQVYQQKRMMLRA